jgi:hypothetical protein
VLARRVYPLRPEFPQLSNVKEGQASRQAR